VIGFGVLAGPSPTLAAADVAFDQAVLDRIHDIAPPGTTINPADNTFDYPVLQPVGRRRQGAS
jgi:hypothetical protein